MRFHRLMAVVALGCAWMLAGCQSDVADEAPPTPRLRPASPPPMIEPSPAPRQAYVPAPAPLPVPPPAAPAKAPPVASKASASGVPSAWIPPVRTNSWNWIIVHHSDSDYGSAAIIDKWHRDRGFDELGYHFVIGNGTNSGDGQIEVGPRWTEQKWGAHDNALDNRYNLHGIGICLVGNFDKTRPTAAQRKSLMRLVVYLMKTYHVTPDRVLGHGETKDTECPGKYLKVADIRTAAQQMLTLDDLESGDKYLAQLTPDGQ